MEVTISPSTWQGLDAWTLASPDLRVVTIPSLGAKLVSLLDRRSGREWLVTAADRPLQPVPYGALFHEQDMSGWDEMFPTIVACAYPGPGEHHGVALARPRRGVDAAVASDGGGCGPPDDGCRRPGAALSTGAHARLPHARHPRTELPADQPGQRCHAVHLGRASAVCVWRGQPKSSSRRRSPKSAIRCRQRGAGVRPKRFFAGRTRTMAPGSPCGWIASDRLRCVVGASYLPCPRRARNGRASCAGRRAIGCTWPGMPRQCPTWGFGWTKAR